MKKTLFFLFIIVLVLIGYFFFAKDEKSQIVDNPYKQYKNSQTNIYFTYPKILTASTTDNTTMLHHQIPYENTGACDMMGEDKTYENLTDFEMSIKRVEMGLTEAVKKFSPYIPQENFINGELIAYPGFIDSFTTTKLNGFAIYEGAEGCGQTIYYLAINKDETYVVTNMAIQALNPSVRNQDDIQKILNTPNVISRDKNEEILTNILKSLNP